MKPLIKKFKSGMHLFHENDRSRELYIIQSGSIKVYRRNGTKEIVLATLEKGSVLGEIALIDGKPRSASAKTVTDCTVIIIDAETFHEKIRGVPPWFISIIKMTSMKIRHANQRLQTVSSEHYLANIIITLNYFYNRFATLGRELNLQKTQIQLVQLLGVGCQQIMNALEFLHKNEFILLNEETIKCTDRSRLQQYCEYLRLLRKKRFTTEIPISDKTYTLIVAIAEKHPGLLLNDDPVKEICGNTFWDSIKLADLQDDYTNSLTQLKDNYIITSTKKDNQEKPSTPLSNYSYKINSKDIKRLYLYHLFKNLNPV
jgi:CRP-like cAMP-binding protein